MTDLVSDFDFALPPERIADHPARPRDSARLLDVPVEGPFMDRHVRDLPGCLRAGDILVANDTAVIPAQLAAMRGAAKIGITLDRILPDGTWHALARNARRLRPGDTLTFGHNPVTAQVVSRGEAGDITLRFSAEGAAFDQFLHDAGRLALPPYIARPDGPTEADRKDYSTIFAQHRGAVAAPTAGLHFTPDLLAALDQAGVIRQTLTLHVGAGTFLPMRSEQISAHHMHAERGTISPMRRNASTPRARRGGGWWPWAPPRCVFWKVRRMRKAACTPSMARRPFSSARLPFPRGGHAADQFSPAAFDAVHAGLRLWRPAPHEGGL